jgi:hypothetical protein
MDAKKLSNFYVTAAVSNITTATPDPLHDRLDKLKVSLTARLDKLKAKAAAVKSTTGVAT